VVHLLASGCLQDLSYSVSVQDGDVESMEVDMGTQEGQGSSGAPLTTTTTIVRMRKSIDRSFWTNACVYER
jgi:hypothetical protein